MENKDQIFAKPLAALSAFRFNAEVAAVFEDMIKRSVPGYEAIITMIGELAGRYLKDGTRGYDLGCSLGAASLAMAQGSAGRDCRIIGIDNSADMVSRCRQLIDRASPPVPIELCCQDILDADIDKASMVVLNFTLQFIAPELRQKLIDKVYQGLLPGGVLIVSEKICFTDSHHQTLMTELHHNFKKANGYSDLEIAQKRSALENVLIPETVDQHKQRFLGAGFNHVDLWFQCFNFASLLAVRT